MPPSPPLAQPSEGTMLRKPPALCLVPGQCREEGTTQCTVGAGGGPGKARASPLPIFWKGSLKPWSDSTLNLLACIQTNCLDSTCAEPYCVFMFLFKREVYLAIIINKWIFFSEATVHASSRSSWWPFSPRRSQQGSLSGSARLSQPPDLPYT